MFESVNNSSFDCNVFLNIKYLNDWIDVALESAGFLNGLGYNATVMVRSIVLRGFDRQMANIVVEEIQDRGVKFIYQAEPQVLCKLRNGQILVFWMDKVMEQIWR